MCFCAFECVLRRFEWNTAIDASLSESRRSAISQARADRFLLMAPEMLRSSRVGRVRRGPLVA
jgi:hypothetical protein